MQGTARAAPCIFISFRENEKQSHSREDFAIWKLLDWKSPSKSVMIPLNKLSEEVLSMKKKLSPLMIAHLALMAVLACASLVSIVVILAKGASADFRLYYGSFSAGIHIASILNIAALGCGMIYLLQGYSKKAAGCYKAFLALTAVFSVFNIYSSFVLRGIGLHVILLAVKVILLLLLAFGKDLGKRKTWIIFFLIVGIDVFVMFTGKTQSVLAYRIVAYLSKLLMDGTIGLAIRGKYADKDARGTR